MEMPLAYTPDRDVLSSNEILLGDNLELLRRIPDGSCNLIYIDPPFNTKKIQKRDRISVTKSDTGTRGGFGNVLYEVQKIASPLYNDTFDDFLGFLEPRLIEAKRILAEDGSFFLHIDYREVHYVKVLLDTIFGRDSFVNEIIGRMTTAESQKIAGPPSTTTSSGMSKTRRSTPTISMLSTAYHTWLQISLALKKLSAVKSRPMSGG